MNKTIIVRKAMIEYGLAIGELTIAHMRGEDKVAENIRFEAACEAVIEATRNVLDLPSAKCDSRDMNKTTSTDLINAAWNYGEASKQFLSANLVRKEDPTRFEEASLRLDHAWSTFVNMTKTID